MPASVSRPRLGREAMAWLLSTKPGMVSPISRSSWSQARMPLMARKAMRILELDFAVGLTFKNTEDVREDDDRR